MKHEKFSEKWRDFEHGRLKRKCGHDLPKNAPDPLSIRRESLFFAILYKSIPWINRALAQPIF